MTIFTDMLRRDREREGLGLARAAWLLSVSVRELRETEAGTAYPSFDTYDRIEKLFGWPQAFVKCLRRVDHRRGGRVDER